MRTTLDLDDRVLRAARGRASLKGISLGQAVSQLALEGLEREHSSSPLVIHADGLVTLAAIPGRSLTPEMVDAALDDA